VRGYLRRTYPYTGGARCRRTSKYVEAEVEVEEISTYR
jgi:hypothetical protein